MIRNSAINLILKLGLAISSLAFAVVSFIRPANTLSYYPDFVISIFGDLLSLTLGSVFAVILAIWIMSQRHKFAAAFTFVIALAIGMITNIGSLTFLAITWPLLCMAGALSLRYYPRIRVIIPGKNGNEKMKIIPMSVFDENTDSALEKDEVVEEKLEKTEIKTPAGNDFNSTMSPVTATAAVAEETKETITASPSVVRAGAVGAVTPITATVINQSTSSNQTHTRHAHEIKTEKGVRAEENNTYSHSAEPRTIEEIRQSSNTQVESSDTEKDTSTDYGIETPYIEDTPHGDEEHKYSPLGNLAQEFSQTAHMNHTDIESAKISNTNEYVFNDEREPYVSPFAPITPNKDGHTRELNSTTLTAVKPKRQYKKKTAIIQDPVNIVFTDDEIFYEPEFFTMPQIPKKAPRKTVPRLSISTDTTQDTQEITTQKPKRVFMRNPSKKVK